MHKFKAMDTKRLNWGLINNFLIEKKTIVATSIFDFKRASSATKSSWRSYEICEVAEEKKCDMTYAVKWIEIRN